MKTYDLNIINQYVADGKISKQVHPILPLSIYKYTLQTQVTNDWDEITKAARGLVLDDQGVAWSNPIPKFLNVEQIDPSEIPNLPYEITDKVDGSCIEVFWYHNELIVCTLGSFTSDQAKVAEKLLTTQYEKAALSLDAGYTYILELVVPENRICVDYGDEEKLVLITVRHNDTGEESLLTDLGFPVVEKINMTLEELMFEKKREDFINKEGFVVKFSNGFRVKVKYEQYFILHRLVTGLSKKYVWEYMSEGKELLFDSIPDEFFKEVEKWKEELTTEYETIEQHAKKVFSLIYVPTESRKDFAMKAKNYNDISSILFKMWTNQPYNMLIWKQVEPKFIGSGGFNSFRK